MSAVLVAMAFFWAACGVYALARAAAPRKGARGPSPTGLRIYGAIFFVLAAAALAGALA